LSVEAIYFLSGRMVFSAALWLGYWLPIQKQSGFWLRIGEIQLQPLLHLP
jgi:hypothetical protein